MVVVVLPSKGSRLGRNKILGLTPLLHTMYTVQAKKAVLILHDVPCLAELIILPLVRPYFLFPLPLSVKSVSVRKQSDPLRPITEFYAWELVGWLAGAKEPRSLAASYHSVNVSSSELDCLLSIRRVLS